MNMKTEMFGIDKHGANCDEIRIILQSIDPLFDVEFNYDKESYAIYFNNGFFRTVKWSKLTREEIEDIAEVYRFNLYGDIISEVDNHNEKIRRSREREREDMINEMAKDFKKAILKEF